MNQPRIRDISYALSARAMEGASSDQVAHAIVGVWKAIDAALGPVIGSQGVAALYQRSHFVALASCAWLGASYPGVQAEIDFQVMKQTFASQSPAIAATAGVTMLRAFYELLTGMLGTDLTDELLEPVWSTLNAQPQGEQGES